MVFAEEMPKMTATQRTNQIAKPDVIVVGGGLAGVCAAIAATESNASVVVIDRASGGGSSAISGGVLYAGGGTRPQREAGYDDDPVNMFRYLQHEVGDAVDEATLRRFCDQSVANLEWLERHGAKFSGSEAPYKTSYPTGEYYLHYSGNEKASGSTAVARPVPRGHRPVGKGAPGMEMTGASLWQSVFDSALRLGVHFELASRVHELIQDGGGRVKGVRYRKIDDPTSLAALSYRWLTGTARQYQTTAQFYSRCLDYLADKVWDQVAVERTLEADHVILAAGGFVMNRAMVDSFIPWGRRTAPLGTAGDDGSGIMLGQSVGGSTSFMSCMTAWRFIYPPEALLDGIIVSRYGERVAAEDTYGAFFTNAMIKKADGHGFLILDSLQWDKFKSQIETQTQGLWRVLMSYIRYWNHKSEPSLESLGQELLVNPVKLKATVEAYNDAIIRGVADPIGKQAHRSVIATGPFYGVDISIQPSGIMMVPSLTLGGLDVDGMTGLVLNEAGKPISGLYAAGRNAVGLCSRNYVSGLSLADCVFSGKRAGEHAAQLR